MSWTGLAAMNNNRNLMKSESVQDNVLWSTVRSQRAGRGTRVTCSLASMTVSLWFLAPHIFLKRLRRGPYLYLIGNHHFVDWSQILIWNNGAQLVVSYPGVPRGFFARTWQLSSCLFSRTDWLPLGLRGWGRLQRRLGHKATDMSYFFKIAQQKGKY